MTRPQHAVPVYYRRVQVPASRLLAVLHMWPGAELYLQVLMLPLPGDERQRDGIAGLGVDLEIADQLVARRYRRAVDRRHDRLAAQAGLGRRAALAAGLD